MYLREVECYKVERKPTKVCGRRGERERDIPPVVWKTKDNEMEQIVAV